MSEWTKDLNKPWPDGWTEERHQYVRDLLNNAHDYNPEFIKDMARRHIAPSLRAIEARDAEIVRLREALSYITCIDWTPGHTKEAIYHAIEVAGAALEAQP